MHTINLAVHPYKYNKATKTFTISEKVNGVIIPFGTEYKILSPTGAERVFTLSHSTGPEFDPSTRYIYKCEELTLEICQDETTTKTRGEAYLIAKTKY